ncbi:LPS-assembly protein LptD [Candidatus Bandiella euplotis]|uniref:LPS-assembly protein LptD n=1 Tax=Candidatus Bandiella euplotis TaxID=1664265 RepID=UPI002B261AF4|nr:LptA/OstA family protein [Candidatus Bandiella woodruffii]
MCIAQDQNKEQKEIEIEADELVYNKAEESIIANGNVHIKQDDLQLMTGKVVYNKKTNYLYAFGNVAFSNDSRNFFFGKEAFLDRNKNSGVIVKFKARLSKKGLLSSDFAKMLDRNRFLVHGLVFSTCSVCDENLKPRTPIWQIKAKEALVDKKEETIKYRHSKVEIFGVPVFYLPYFSMPTPQAHNRSGFLAPKFKNSNILGFQTSIPYYFSILPQMDLTYTPTFSTKENAIHNLSFRHLTNYGLYEIETYFTHRDAIDEKKSFKGLFQTSGNFKLKNNYFFDYDSKRVLDNSKKFIQKYNISKDDVFTSKFSLRKEKKDNMLLMFDTIFFQDLRKGEINNKKDTPSVLPWVRTYNKVPVKLPFGYELIFSTDLLNLTREEGTNYKRATFQLDMLNNTYLPLGQVLGISPSIRYDYYNIHYTADKSTSKSRVLGKLLMNWRWPFIKHQGHKNIILEPIVNFSYNSSATGNFLKEDGQEQLINASNVFASNFFTGKDIIDFGSSINYGLRANYYTEGNTYGAVLGQSYKLNRPKELEHNISYSWNDKIIGQKSEIVAKLYTQIGSDLSFVNNISLSPNRFDLIKNELDANMKYRKLVFGLGHVFIKEQYINKCYNDYNQEISGKLQYNFYQKWWLEAKAKRKIGHLTKEEKIDQYDLNAKEKNKNISKWVSNEISLLYKGDCLKINFGIERDYSMPKGLKPSFTTYMKIEPIFN